MNSCMFVVCYQFFSFLSHIVEHFMSVAPPCSLSLSHRERERERERETDTHTWAAEALTARAVDATCACHGCRV